MRKFIHQCLRGMAGSNAVYVKEFTYGSYRIDSIIIDLRKRWIRGFEIKMTRADFLKDEKWQSYTEFTSSLSIVCPDGLITPEEINKPFGLLYVKNGADHGRTLRWVKKPTRFQRRDGMAWLYLYLRVLEKEFPRMSWELEQTERKLWNLVNT